MASKQADLKGAIEQACRSGEEFSSVYFETFDKRRHLIGKLYSDNCTLVWNGNYVTGGEKVKEFLTNLPPSENTMVTSLDCQPVSDQAIPGQTTILVVLEGTIEYEGHKPRSFSQNLILTTEGVKCGESRVVWKVASDCFRFIDS